MSLKDEEADPEPIEVSQGVFEKPQVLELGNPATWRTVQTFCQGGAHNYVPDESETDFEALKCTKCHHGVLVKRKTKVQ